MGALLQVLSEAMNAWSMSRKTVILYTILTLPFFTFRLLSDGFITFSPITEWSASYIYCNTFLQCQILLNLAIISYVTQHKLFLKNSCNSTQVTLTWHYGFITVPNLLCDFTIWFLVFIVPPNVSPPAAHVFAGLSGLIALIYMVFVSIWLMVLVIAVLEENCHGWSAVCKAFEFCRRHLLHGFDLMCVFSMILLTVVGLLGFLISASEKGKVICYGSVVALASLVCPLVLFMFELAVVLYQEDRRNHCGKIDRDEALSLPIQADLG